MCEENVSRAGTYHYCILSFANVCLNFYLNNLKAFYGKKIKMRVNGKSFLSCRAIKSNLRHFFPLFSKLNLASRITGYFTTFKSSLFCIFNLAIIWTESFIIIIIPTSDRCGSYLEENSFLCGTDIRSFTEEWDRFWRL